MFVISRIEHYKFSECAAVFAEAERCLTHYDNPDWHSDKVGQNYHLIEKSFSGSLESYLLDLKKEYRCRMSIDSTLPREKQTNVMSQAFFGASPEFFDGMTPVEIRNYFEHCLSFFQSKFTSVEVLSAVVHMDETTPHLHISFLPLTQKKNSKGIEKTVFSTSDLFRGKDFFADYQDSFYSYMNDRYSDYHLERKGPVKQDHLTIREYKRIQNELSSARDELADLQEIAADLRDKPSIDIQIENARLRKELSLYARFIAYLRQRFPQLEPLFRTFNQHRIEIER